jgi:hypothetical protein
LEFLITFLLFSDPKVLLNDWQSNTANLIGQLNGQYKDQQLDFARPPADTDVLTMLTAEGNVVVFPHPNASRSTPLYHLGPVGSMFTLRVAPTKAETNQAPVIPVTPLKPTKKPKNLLDANAENQNGNAPELR